MHIVGHAIHHSGAVTAMFSSCKQLVQYNIQPTSQVISTVQHTTSNVYQPEGPVPLLCFVLCCAVCYSKMLRLTAGIVCLVNCSVRASS